LILNANNISGGSTKFAVTRYGNIAGSAGSVIPTWRAILRRDPMAPVPVTDVACTRFWMTIAEAVQLVFAQACKPEPQTGLIIPDWLPAYELGTLAEAMGVKNMLVTGLPAHEKRHEGMREGLTSDNARRMTVGELREGLRHV
jgi:UDP-N-acetylglucosamine 4,6-dehydratase